MGLSVQLKSFSFLQTLSRSRLPALAGFGGSAPLDLLNIYVHRHLSSTFTDICFLLNEKFQIFISLLLFLMFDVLPASAKIKLLLSSLSSHRD
jgi:hypothetical protein